MMSKRVRVSKIGETVLGIVAVAGIIAVSVCAPNALQILKPFLKEKKYNKKQVVERNIDSLVRSGMLRKIIDAHGEVKIELTRKGEWESYIRGVFHKKQKWDGKWRVVIFDVPNTQSKCRRELTRGMRLYGFEQMQKSAWIYPYPCPDFIMLLKKHLELDEVVYLTVSDIDDEKKWRGKFRV